MVGAEKDAALQQGWALPLAIVAGLVLLISTAALSSRSVQGFLSSVFQGVNREARDVAESSITEFGVTMNREENRLLLVAGQGATWSDIKHRNPCTASSQQPDGTWSALPSDLDDALAASTSVTASRFVPSNEWQNLNQGDDSRQFKVTKVEYLYEAADGSRTGYDSATPNDNFPGDTVKTVRDSALEGGTRTLMRVTIVGKVNRNGQVSFARVAREFEVVPKCCKRSFGNNIGAIAWGRDRAACPVKEDSGVGNGLIGSLNGGAPESSNNTLDIRDESDKLITQALCWAGNDPAKSSDLSGSPNEKCVDGSQSLGAATKTKSGVSFVPTEFSLKLPNPKFDTGGRLDTLSAASLTVTSLNVQYSDAAFGTWISDGVNYWMKLFDEEWKSFNPALVAKPWTYSVYSRVSVLPCLGGNRIQVQSTNHGLAESSNLYLNILSGGLPSGNGYKVHTCPNPPTTNIFNINNTTSNSGQLLWMSGGSSPVTPRSFGGCIGSVGDFSACRWETNRILNLPYPQVAPASASPVAIPRVTANYSSATRIYLDPATLVMMQKIGTANPQPMTNCVVNKDPAAPYAVADCRYSRIESSNRDVIVDTSYAMVNFYFDDSLYNGEYMGGAGNTVYKRVHCSRSGWTVNCSDDVTWSDYQVKCDPSAASRDVNCAVANPKYDQSELWNVFTMGGGSFVLKGGSGVAGANVYAPMASVTLKGGGNPRVIDFMGRIWTDDITLVGNVSIRVPKSQAAFCTTACPGGAQVPKYDVVARSFSHASGF